MKKYLNKNQIIISVIALMLIAAGYMNYTMGEKGNLEGIQIIDSKEYADLGDATLVSSNITNENEIKEVKTKEENSEDQYFSKSRLDRDTMYSQMMDSYQKILNNNQLTPEQKTAAAKEIENINIRKNAIMISENLIKNKGFEDVIIFVNNYSIEVIVKAKELKEEQVAQIQSIIERELNTETSNIHISNRE